METNMDAKTIVETIHLMDDFTEILKVINSVRTNPKRLRQALESLGPPGTLEEAIVFIAAQTFAEVQDAVREFEAK